MPRVSHDSLMAVSDLVTLRVVDDILRLTIGRLPEGKGEAARAQPVEDGIYARLLDGIALSVRASLELKPAGVIVDVRGALRIWGPMSVDSLGRLLAMLGAVKVTTAVILGEEPVHQLQLSRLVTEYGGASMAISRSEDEARLAIRNAGSGTWAVSTGVRLQALFGDLRLDSVLPKKVK